jgi:hypothetical protein
LCSSSPILDLFAPFQHPFDATASDTLTRPHPASFHDALEEAHTAVLEEGDVLYLPALWHHNTLALDPSISVNVFWRSLPLTDYERKDLYGNRDVIPAVDALGLVERGVTRMTEGISDLGFREFYAEKMRQIIEYSLLSTKESDGLPIGR